MKKILYVCALLSALSWQGASAQTTLTLQQARQQALDNNKTLNADRLKIEKQKHDTKAIYSNFFPNFSANAVDVYSTGSKTFNLGLTDIFAEGIQAVSSATAGIVQEIGMASPEAAALLGQYMAQGEQIASLFKLPDDYLKLKIGNVFAGGISFVEPLYMGGKINTGYKMSRLGEKMAATNVRLSESEVLVQTDEAYALCLRAREMGEVAKAYNALLIELQKNVEGAVRHGMKTRNDALKVQVKLNESELAITKAENGYRLAQMNLAHVCGIPLTERIEVAPIDEVSAPALTDASDITSRPEYELLADKSEIARMNVKLTRSEFLPSLVLAAGGSYANGIHFLNQTMLNNFGFSAGLILKVPLFHFGEGKHKVRSAKVQYQIAQLEQDNLNELMNLELQQAKNNLTESTKELEIAHKSLLQAEENLKMSKQAYDVGTEPLSDLFEAQTLWQKASAQLVEAKCNLNLSNTKYLKASGMLR